MSWNGYPRYIQNKIIKRIENQKNTKNNDTLETTKYCHDFLQNTLCRSARKTLIKNLIKKFKRDLNKPFKLRNIYCTKS